MKILQHHSPSFSLHELKSIFDVPLALTLSHLIHPLVQCFPIIRYTLSSITACDTPCCYLHPHHHTLFPRWFQWPPKWYSCLRPCPLQLILQTYSDLQIQVYHFFFLLKTAQWFITTLRVKFFQFLCGLTRASHQLLPFSL